MTAKPGPTNARRRPVPDLEKLGQAIGYARDDLVLLQRKIEALRADLDNDLLTGGDTTARRAALRDLVRQERVVNQKIEELSAKISALDASRLDEFVSALTKRAVADTKRVLAEHSRTINLSDFQQVRKAK